jgi:hypothetical protein
MNKSPVLCCPYSALGDKFYEGNVPLCHPEQREEPALSLSKGSRRWRYYSAASVGDISEALRFFAPLRSAQNDSRRPCTHNDKLGRYAQNDKFIQSRIQQ